MTLSTPSISSISKFTLALPLCAALMLLGSNTPSAADPLARGVEGAVGGAIIGGIINGGKGARKGAIIGGTVGVIGGAMEEERRREYYRSRRDRRAAYDSYKPLPTSDLVYETQVSLARLGYNPGPVDGVMGRKTANAVASYEDDSSLPVTGEPSPGLLSHMRKHGG